MSGGVSGQESPSLNQSIFDLYDLWQVYNQLKASSFYMPTFRWVRHCSKGNKTGIFNLSICNIVPPTSPFGFLNISFQQHSIHATPCLNQNQPRNFSLWGATFWLESQNGALVTEISVTTQTTVIWGCTCIKAHLEQPIKSLNKYIRTITKVFCHNPVKTRWFPFLNFYYTWC